MSMASCFLAPTLVTDLKFSFRADDGERLTLASETLYSCQVLFGTVRLAYQASTSTSETLPPNAPTTESNVAYRYERGAVFPLRVGLARTAFAWSEGGGCTLVLNQAMSDPK